MMFGFSFAATVLVSIVSTFAVGDANFSANSSDPQIVGWECKGVEAPNPFTPVFYDMECLAKMDGKLRCPMDVAEEFVAHFALDLRMEASMLTLAQFFCVVCILQAASIPVPAAGDRKGTFLYSMWMFLQLCQAALCILSLMMLPLIFSSASIFIGDCAVQFGELTPLLSLAAFLAASFHPTVAAMAGSVALSLDAVVQGAKLFRVARPEAVMNVCLHYMCLGGAAAVVIFMLLFVLLPALYHAACFMASFAFVFGLAIFAPMALAMVVCLGLVTQLMLGLGMGLGLLLPEAATRMLWWLPRVASRPDTANWPRGFIFHGLITYVQMTVLLLCTSGIGIWGTWLALLIYNGANAAEVGEMIATSYSWVFDVFISLEFKMPTMTLDPLLVPEAIQALGNMANFRTVPPGRLLEGCHALSSLSTLIALLKLPVTASSRFRDYLSGTIDKTVSVVAIFDMRSGGVTLEDLSIYCPEAEAKLYGVRVPDRE